MPPSAGGTASCSSPSAASASWSASAPPASAKIQLRLASHRFYAADLRETIRLGLIGGGEDLAGAEALMRFNFDQQPLATHLQLAADLLSAAVAGVEPEGNGGTEGRRDAPATSPSGTAPAA